jgi:hypothetical protein
MVAARKTRDGNIELYAPFGVEDALARIMRTNPWFPQAPHASYEKKAARWRTLWPELQVQSPA